LDQWRKILCAAIVVGPECTLEELVVASWKMWPDEFCLEGYPEYPHALVVHSKIYGANGLARRGWLSISLGTVRVTKAGRDEMLRYTNPDGDER